MGTGSTSLSFTVVICSHLSTESRGRPPSPRDETHVSRRARAWLVEHGTTMTSLARSLRASIETTSTGSSFVQARPVDVTALLHVQVRVRERRPRRRRGLVDDRASRADRDANSAHSASSRFLDSASARRSRPRFLLPAVCSSAWREALRSHCSMIALRVVFSLAALRSTTSSSAASTLMLILSFRAAVILSILLIALPSCQPFRASHLRPHRLLDGADQLVGRARDHLDRLRIAEDRRLQGEQLRRRERLAAGGRRQQRVDPLFGRRASVPAARAPARPDAAVAAGWLGRWAAAAAATPPPAAGAAPARSPSTAVNDRARPGRAAGCWRSSVALGRPAPRNLRA